MLNGMKTARFVPSQIWTIAQADSGNAVFIRPEGMDVVLPVYVSESDIQTLLVELTHILAPRPMVHELMLASIEALRGKLDRVEIYGIRGGTYLCRVVLVQNGKESRLESRPSDILCLSARVECPINVDNDVLTRNAVPIDSVSANGEAPITAASGETAQNASPQDGLPVSSRESSSFAANLLRELQAAIDREDYESAASLRDRLNAIVRLQSGQV
jgi:bifunctional DNase/RNase